MKNEDERPVIPNTARIAAEAPELYLLRGMDATSQGKDPSAVIEEDEARGQQSFVRAAGLLLPSQLMGYDPVGLEELLKSWGFELGDPLKDDPLFRDAKLPEGWKVNANPEYVMWSRISDERGVERIAVFYKAAPYDRKAHMAVCARWVLDVSPADGSAYARHDAPHRARIYDRLALAGEVTKNGVLLEDVGTHAGYSEANTAGEARLNAIHPKWYDALESWRSLGKA